MMMTSPVFEPSLFKNLVEKQTKENGKKLDFGVHLTKNWQL
jgi:hypothetical protein